MKLRISKNGKFSKSFPQAVANQIREIAQDYKIASCTVQDTDPSRKFYVGEGDRFTGLFPDGKSASFEVVSANTLGAANVSHSIGSEFSMPSQTYLVRVSYYTRYFMVIYRIGNLAIEA